MGWGFIKCFKLLFDTLLGFQIQCLTRISTNDCRRDEHMFVRRRLSDVGEDGGWTEPRAQIKSSSNKSHNRMPSIGTNFIINITIFGFRASFHQQFSLHHGKFDEQINGSLLSPSFAKSNHASIPEPVEGIDTNWRKKRKNLNSNRVETDGKHMEGRRRYGKQLDSEVARAKMTSRDTKESDRREWCIIQSSVFYIPFVHCHRLRCRRPQSNHFTKETQPLNFDRSTRFKSYSFIIKTNKQPYLFRNGWVVTTTAIPIHFQYAVPDCNAFGDNRP